MPGLPSMRDVVANVPPVDPAPQELVPVQTRREADMGGWRALVS